jgi:hypothetical protein
MTTYSKLNRQFNPDKIGFDNTLFTPFRVKETQSLATALTNRQIQEDTPVLAFELGEGFGPRQVIALPLYQMAYHHVAQGEWNGIPWLVSFCGVCNSGMAFNPKINGRVHQFIARGVYDAIQLIYDEETGSYWDFITGEAVHGPLKGYQMDSWLILHMQAGQVAKRFPNAQVAISRLGIFPWLFSRFNKYVVLSKRGFMVLGFRNTIGGKPDTRRPELDLGLGLWADNVYRYYPLETLRARQNVILDTVNGQSVLVYIDPISQTPLALYLDAKNFEWHGQELYMDGDKWRIYDKVLFDADGTAQDIDYPMQLFTRWYGFALTFPGCEIYGELCSKNSA